MSTKDFIRHPITAAILAAGMLPGIAASDVVDAEVKFDPTASGNHTIMDINEFDWQSSGDAVIEDQLPAPAVANGVEVNTFSAWAAGAVVGDAVAFNVHVHARLNDFLNNDGNSIAPDTLSKDGASCAAGSDCFEVTAAASLLETATLVGAGTILITSASGNYAYYLDTAPNSDVSSGAGFNDGIAFLNGNIGFEFIVGTFTQNVGGDSLFDNTVTAQNTDIIDVQNGGNLSLAGTSYDILLSPPGTFDAVVGVGGSIGLLPYTVQVADLVIKGDANSEFTAIEDEVLGACRMTGGGVDVEGTAIDGTLAEASDGGDRSTFGGQLGAPSATQPQPFGHWTHHQQKGPSGSFQFHVGTASAPPETRIVEITCFDEGFCNPARPAYFKQLDWKGVGTFANVKGALSSQVVTQNHKNYTLHCIEGHFEDIGEPGPGGKQPKSNQCNHVPRTLISEGSDCTDCPDIYQMQIYDRADCNDPDKQVIYSWGWPDGGFIGHGNIQIHPEVGQQPPK